MPYLSASEVMFHEGALYQVFVLYLYIWVLCFGHIWWQWCYRIAW